VDAGFPKKIRPNNLVPGYAKQSDLLQIGLLQRVRQSRAMFGPARAGPSSDSSYQNQYDDDDQNQAESAARVVAPAGRIRPGRQCADEQQDQYDYQYRTEHGVSSLRSKPSGKRRHCIKVPNTTQLKQIALLRRDSGPIGRAEKNLSESNPLV
jgi:hypothetical protein